MWWLRSLTPRAGLTPDLNYLKLWNEPGSEPWTCQFFSRETNLYVLEYNFIFIFVSNFRPKLILSVPYLYLRVTHYSQYTLPGIVLYNTMRATNISVTLARLLHGAPDMCSHRKARDVSSSVGPKAFIFILTFNSCFLDLSGWAKGIGDERDSSINRKPVPKILVILTAWRVFHQIFDVLSNKTLRTIKGTVRHRW